MPPARRLIGRCRSGWGRRALGLALRELRPRLPAPAPAAGLSGPGSSDVPRQECPSSDNVIYISGRVRGSAAPGARRPLCQEPRAALLPLRRRCRPRAPGGRRSGPRAGESREGPAAGSGERGAGAQGWGARRGRWVRWAQRASDASCRGRCPRCRMWEQEGCGAPGGRGGGGCSSDHPRTRNPALAQGSEARSELGACLESRLLEKESPGRGEPD